jgi:hypothetical protein
MTTLAAKVREVGFLLFEIGLKDSILIFINLAGLELEEILKTMTSSTRHHNAKVLGWLSDPLQALGRVSEIFSAPLW